MPTNIEPTALVWILTCTVFIMLMQVGFCCVESGLIRAKNSINVAIKNLVDFMLAVGIFWLFGYGLMFGASQGGWIGTSDFLFGDNASASATAFFAFQLMFCGTAVTIISGAVAERMKFVGYLAMTVIVAALVYPIIGHWIWGGVAAGTPTGWLAKLGFIDFAGSTVVHSVGGWAALAAIIVIGPRRGRFDKKGKPIHGHNLSLAAMGTLFLWIGWIGFNGGSTFLMSNAVPGILVNTILAGAIGGIVALAVSWYFTRYPNAVQAMKGVLGGLVAVTASCNAVSPAGAIIIGALAGIIVYAADVCLIKLKIDDAVSAVPIHAACGIWGTLAVAIFADSTAWTQGVTRWEQLGIQAAGVAVACAWAFGITFVALKLVNIYIPLRVTPKEEDAGLNISEHGISTAIIELLNEMDEHRIKSDFTDFATVEPNTEVGQIATQYNRVLTEINSRSQRMTNALEYATKSQERSESAIAELKEMNLNVVGRELQMIELKRQINQLCTDLNQPLKYDLTELDEADTFSKAGVS